VAEEAAVAKAYEMSRRVGVIEVGRGRVYSGPVLSYLASTHLIAMSFTAKPNGSNSMEQELLAMK
jgi:hypothetical protein